MISDSLMLQQTKRSDTYAGEIEESFTALMGQLSDKNRLSAKGIKTRPAARPARKWWN